MAPVTTRSRLVEHWPLFGLEILTPRLVLRPPTDDDLAELINVVHAGIHDPATMPFLVPWTDQQSPELERTSLQFWWSCRANWSVANWRLGLAVFLDGRPIGMQDIAASDFRVVRSAETGSWLGRSYQSRGIGTEMRHAIATFAFDFLGASEITSSAFFDNASSQAVSEKVGYEHNGLLVKNRRGEPTESRQFRLTRERFDQVRASIADNTTVAVTGFEPCASMFGM